MNSSVSIRWVLIAFLLASSPQSGAAQVVINEFAYDDTQDDDEEFVELFNAADAGVDLSGWFLETGDALGPGPRYDFPAGTFIEAGGHLVAGSALVPGVDVVLEGADLFGNGPAYIILRDGEMQAADAVAYEANKGTAGFPPDALSRDAIWGNHMLIASTHLSWQRWYDGWNTGEVAADFGHLPWTPGASNDREDPPDFWSDFEDGAIDQDVETLAGSFVPGRIIDPAFVSLSNPSEIPESPDGGLALIAWDASGGGNFVVLDSEPAADMMFEAWVYFNAAARIGEESETWSIGLGGTSGTFYNTPILFNANGNTGVTWTFQTTSSGSTLYLVDEGLGGPAAGRVHLATIPVLAGENDGWQRLRLEVQGTRVTGYFGGTYGAVDDGVVVEGTLRAPPLGNFYIGYREDLTDNATARPPTLDALVVGPPGAGSPTFRRGDSNADGETNLSDAVFLLNHLFLGGEEPPCLEAGDVDADGALNLTDAIFLLNHLFLGGPGPQAPFPDCGTAAAAGGLSCKEFPPCF